MNNCRFQSVYWSTNILEMNKILNIKLTYHIVKIIGLMFYISGSLSINGSAFINTSQYTFYHFISYCHQLYYVFYIPRAIRNITYMIHFISTGKKQSSYLISRPGIFFMQIGPVTYRKITKYLNNLKTLIFKH